MEAYSHKFQLEKNMLRLIYAIWLLILIPSADVMSSNTADTSSFIDKAKFIREHREKQIKQLPQEAILANIDADSSHSWDALHYNIAMELFPSVQEIDAQVTIIGLSNSAELDSLPLHFAPGMSITSIYSGGQSVGYDWIGQDLSVELDRIYGIGYTFNLEISYSGHPPMISNPNSIGSMGIFWGNTIYTYTDPEGARAWFPCFDKPFDKATYSAQYTLPDNWAMASNGQLDSTVVNPNNTKTTYWSHNYPIETYLISIAASSYSQFSDYYNDLPLQYYVYPWHLTAAQNDFQDVPEMIECFELNYSLYPFEKYGMAEAPIFYGGGAMEHQTMTTLGDQIITGMGTGELLIAHELSHMWFGDALSIIDWSHMWLNEGFATYSEAVWVHYRYGWYAFLEYVQNNLQNVYMGWENPSNRHPIYNPPPGYLFSPVEYEKAGSILHMLRYLMGDQTFFDMMQDYFTTYKYGCVSTDDFQEKCEEYYGNSLDWFFQQWIYDEGFPVFEYFTAYESVSPAVWEISTGISQTQDETLPTFKTYIDVSVFNDGEIVYTDTVWIENRYELINFQYTGSEPDSIVLDPNSWILGRKLPQGQISSPLFSITGYQWTSEFLSQGTTDSLVVTCFNNGLGVDNVRGTLTTTDPDLTIPPEDFDFGYAGFMSQFSNINDPIPVVLNSGAVSHWASMEIFFQWDNGDTTIAFMLPVGNPTLFYADDDGGEESDTLMKRALDSLMIVYETWDVIIQGLPQDFSLYEAVVWDCGHSDESLNDFEIDLLSNYLDLQGRLLITGSNIASSLQGNSFLTDYLGADFASQTSMPIINGVIGDPVGGDISLYLLTTENDQDALNAVGTGITCLNYIDNQPAGIRMDAGYKSLLLGFCLGEARWDNPNFNTPADVLYNTFNWFDMTVQITDIGSDNRGNFSLISAYPNPFNSELTIEFFVDVAGRYSIEVYNILGQRTADICEAGLSPGRHRVHWDSGDTGSGIYLIKISGPQDRNIYQKVVLMK